MCVAFCVLVSGKILYCILCIYMIFHRYVHCPNILFHFTVIGKTCTVIIVQNLYNNWQKLHNYVWKNMKKLLKGKFNNHVYKSNFCFSQLNTFYSCNLTINRFYGCWYLKLIRNACFHPILTCCISKHLKIRFIPDSRGDTRQNHLKIIEHEPYFKEIYMFIMCPLIVIMIFAAKCEHFPLF